MKTLGTTQAQIKSLVKSQAVQFACIGIPIGLLLATAVSFGIVPLVLNEGFEQGKSIMDAEVFFHPSIYILSILFSAVTVWIACNAPAKAAAKISPVEALKFQNFAPKKTKSRNSTNGGKLHVMAFQMCIRDRWSRLRNALQRINLCPLLCTMRQCSCLLYTSLRRTDLFRIRLRPERSFPCPRFSHAWPSATAERLSWWCR